MIFWMFLGVVSYFGDDEKIFGVGGGVMSVGFDVFRGGKMSSGRMPDERSRKMA